MKTKVGRDWYQSIYFDKLSCRQVSFFWPQMNTITTGSFNVLSALSNLVYFYFFRRRRIFADFKTGDSGVFTNARSATLCAPTVEVTASAN